MSLTPVCCSWLCFLLYGLYFFKERIEKKIQRRIDTITAAQVIGLRKIYNSLTDGMSSVADWFEIEEAQSDKPKTGVDAAKAAMKSSTIKEPEKTEIGPEEAARIQEQEQKEGKLPM